MTKLPPSDGERLARVEELLDKLITEHNHIVEKVQSLQLYVRQLKTDIDK